MVNKSARLRNDLLKKGIKVPIGNIYYYGNEMLNYRWLNDDLFQVYFNFRWMDAYSIDWDFVNKKPL